MNLLKKVAIAGCIVAAMSPITTANASTTDWSMSLKPFTGWQSHWSDADMRSGAASNSNAGWFSVSRIEHPDSWYVTARTVNNIGEVRSGRVKVKQGGTGNFGANKGMTSGYKYTVQVYNNYNTPKYVWSHGDYCIK